MSRVLYMMCVLVSAVQAASDDEDVCQKRIFFHVDCKSKNIVGSECCDYKYFLSYARKLCLEEHGDPRVTLSSSPVRSLSLPKSFFCKAFAWGMFDLPKGSIYFRKKITDSDTLSICISCARTLGIYTACKFSCARSNGVSPAECSTADMFNFDPSIECVYFPLKKYEDGAEENSLRNAVPIVGLLSLTTFDNKFYWFYRLSSFDSEDDNILTEFYCTELVDLPYSHEFMDACNTTSRRMRIKLDDNGVQKCIPLFDICSDANPEPLSEVEMSIQWLEISQFMFRDKDFELVDVHRVWHPEEFQQAALTKSKEKAKEREEKRRMTEDEKEKYEENIRSAEEMNLLLGRNLLISLKKENIEKAKASGEDPVMFEKISNEMFDKVFVGIEEELWTIDKRIHGDIDVPTRTPLQRKLRRQAYNQEMNIDSPYNDGFTLTRTESENCRMQ